MALEVFCRIENFMSAHKRETDHPLIKYVFAHKLTAFFCRAVSSNQVLVSFNITLFSFDTQHFSTFFTPTIHPTAGGQHNLGNQRITFHAHIYYLHNFYLSALREHKEEKTTNKKSKNQKKNSNNKS